MVGYGGFQNAGYGRSSVEPGIFYLRNFLRAPDTKRLALNPVSYNQRMRILISYDDGYFAPGLNILAQHLSQLAEIVVVAPERNRSGASNSLTLDRPLTVREAHNGFRYVNGTPTDCVHLALTGLMDEPPDMVISGINDGANMGDDTIYSGTVAAAMEGYLLGIPSFAVSM